MKQTIVGGLNNVLFLLVAVFSVGYFAGIEVEEVSATAPTGFASQAYEDSNGDGVVDQVVIVIDGAEELTTCAVADIEVEADWTYTGNDIGGLLVLSEEAHSCDLTTGTITLKITGANENTTGHTVAPTIAYSNADLGNSIANASGNLGDVIATDIADGAAPVAISAIYNVDSDEIINGIDVTYSENIGGSIFTEGEWSLPINPHSLVISSGEISGTDVNITVTNSNDSTTINDTTVKYTAGTGITDGANYAVDAELSISVNEKEEEEYITPPDDAIDGPATPNINSGVTLYRMPGDPRVYVIKNKKKHWIKTPKEFKNNGYKWSEIQEISAELLEEYPEAETLVTELLRAVGDHKVYKLENGKRHWIKTAGEFNAAGYKWKDIREVSPETIASYQNAVLSDLLRAVGDYKVYKIKDGKKRWVRTAKEFNAARYNWKDVEEVSIETLNDYPDSE